MPRSTADARRAAVLQAAVTVFARTGYHATPVTEVADAAGISQAYVFRLFGGKLGLFVAAVEHCNDTVLATLSDGADAAAGDEPDAVLDAMGVAYAQLIADKDLLMLQVHAQSACDIPEVREAVRRGYAAAVTFVSERTGAGDDAVQRFFATGLLCHLVVTAGLVDDPAPWARLLSAGIRHFD